MKKDEAKSNPEPVIKIDNHTDPYHTIVSITYGDKLGELSDTVGLPVAQLVSYECSVCLPTSCNAGLAHAQEPQRALGPDVQPGRRWLHSRP